MKGFNVFFFSGILFHLHVKTTGVWEEYPICYWTFCNYLLSCHLIFNNILPEVCVIPSVFYFYDWNNWFKLYIVSYTFYSTGLTMWGIKRGWLLLEFFPLHKQCCPASGCCYSWMCHSLLLWHLLHSWFLVRYNPTFGTA